jgi:hypothetical protein
VLVCGRGRRGNGKADLSSLTREVVGGLEGAGDALLDGRVAAVVGGQDRVLEASGVLDINVELAVLALLGDGDAGADGGDVGVEDEGHDGAVTRDLGAHGALRASGSTIADTSDQDLSLVRWCYMLSILKTYLTGRGSLAKLNSGKAGAGERSSEGSESKEPLHIE